MLEASPNMQVPLTSDIPILPNELLAKIFKLSIEYPITISPTVTNDSLPWSLFLVCKQWWHVVTGTPELWRNIIIDYEDQPWCLEPRTGDSERVTRTARRALLQNNNMPLSVEMYSHGLNKEEQESIINLIALCSHQMKYLKLALCEETLRKLFSLPLNFNCLAFISINRCDGPGANEDLSPLVFSNAPLRAAELERYNWLLKSPDHPGECGTLTHLSLYSESEVSPLTAYKILRIYPNLVFLQIHLSKHDSPDDMYFETYSREAYPYPSLKTLFVNTSLPNVLIYLFMLVDFPSLTRLEIAPREQSYSMDWSHSRVLSTVLGLKELHTFSITIPIHSSYNMHSFLSSLPGLIDINLLEIPENLLSSVYSGELLPNLQTLRVPVIPQIFNLYLSMMSEHIGRDLTTQVRIEEDDWEEYLIFEADRDGREKIKELMRCGALQVVHDYDTDARIEEFFPSDLKMWN
ncbi:hypothetical protein BDZ94DRAFT_1265663 [Collybia nuda]|uniref:F-box domain-containing protein n=1 Tax=Collybia nuda TaxID=64659 RepID=A0A9P6CH51_9AGAR|nr:hypothetical protein BDZ94DRAFT_1265663 [Collybia nuda]